MSSARALSQPAPSSRQLMLATDEGWPFPPKQKVIFLTQSAGFYQTRERQRPYFQKSTGSYFPKNLLAFAQLASSGSHTKYLRISLRLCEY